MRNPCLHPCDDEIVSPGAAAEAALVREMLNGSQRAWRELHDRYGRLIYSCVARVTSRFASLVGQDDVSEIYAIFVMQLLANDMRKLRSFDPSRGTRLSTWLGLLAARCAYDYLRAARREPNRLPLSEAEDVLCELPDPHEHAEHRERAAMLDGVLRDFSDKDREFVTLYFGEGLPADEIAQRMQISVKTVYSKRHKIQSRLEAMLSEARLAA